MFTACQRPLILSLYGEDPAHRPDIFGKIGESGVGIATLDDMKLLYKGFDLCARTTSVSKTINGPAPILLAMFLTQQSINELTFEQEEQRNPQKKE